jgi:superfamily II DNA helicase RecQ
LRVKKNFPRNFHVNFGSRSAVNPVMSECRAGSGGKLKQTLLFPKKSIVSAPSNSLRQNAIVIMDDEVPQAVAPLIQSSLVPLLPVSSSPLEALQRYFGHSSFRNGQEQVIQSILKGVDSIAVFPTGAGKSLLFQLPSLMLPGLTVVVSPLIALMEDQVAQLSNRNIKALCIHSSLTAGARRDIMADLTQMTLPDQAVNTHLLYATPELLTSSEFQNEYLKPLYAQNKLSLFAIDEVPQTFNEWSQILL